MPGGRFLDRAFLNRKIYGLVGELELPEFVAVTMPAVAATGAIAAAVTTTVDAPAAAAEEEVAVDDVAELISPALAATGVVAELPATADVWPASTETAIAAAMGVSFTTPSSTVTLVRFRWASYSM